MGPRQEKRHDENKSITDSAKKTRAVARPRKRRCNESESIADSPKKPCYNKASTSMEKRDKKYCSTIANSKLQSIRITPDESEDDFNGFIEGDADENAYWVKRRISILEFAQEFIKNELTSEGQSETIDIPEVAPIENQDVDASQDVTNVSSARKDPVGGE